MPVCSLLMEMHILKLFFSGVTDLPTDTKLYVNITGGIHTHQL